MLVSEMDKAESALWVFCRDPIHLQKVKTERMPGGIFSATQSWEIYGCELS